MKESLQNHPSVLTVLKNFWCNGIMSPVLIAVVLIAMLLLFFKVSTTSLNGRKQIVAYTKDWCPACQKLQPEWDRLHAMCGAELLVLQVKDQKCDHYPTIISNGIEYSGPREAEAMKAWAMAA